MLPARNNHHHPPPPPAPPSQPPYVDGLNEQQRDAVLAPLDEPLELVAGAGSGKTAVLTRRIQHMLASGVAARNILAVTFTTAAADEMRSRLEKAVGKAASRAVSFSTFHSLSLAICRSHAELAGRQRDFAVRTPRQQIKVVRQALSELRLAQAAEAAASKKPASAAASSSSSSSSAAAVRGGAQGHADGNAASAAGSSSSSSSSHQAQDPARLLSSLMRLKAQGVSPEAVAHMDAAAPGTSGPAPGTFGHAPGTFGHASGTSGPAPPVPPVLAYVYRRYAELMQEANAFDMLDFLLVATRALSSASEGSAKARQALHDRYTHVLVVSAARTLPLLSPPLLSSPAHLQP
jgi:superfamily I DNA/RNA helicase